MLFGKHTGKTNKSKQARKSPEQHKNEYKVPAAVWQDFPSLWWL